MGVTPKIFALAGLTARAPHLPFLFPGLPLLSTGQVHLYSNNSFWDLNQLEHVHSVSMVIVYLSPWALGQIPHNLYPVVIRLQACNKSHTVPYV